MRIEVTFREGHPAVDMTRDEVVTWLLGGIGSTSLSAGLMTAFVVTRLVDGLPDGTELPVEAEDGSYVLTVTTARRLLRCTRTYHVRLAGEAS